jgi:hypothetical protein
MNNTNQINYAINYEVASAERMSGEYMLINFDTGTYFSATDLGADIITLIDERVDRNSWEMILLKSWNLESSVGLDAQVNDFLESLIRHNLIYKIDIFDNADSKLPEDLDRQNFAFSPLKVYEDMSDLLMVDPIHDTSLKGWPDVETHN